MGALGDVTVVAAPFVLGLGVLTVLAAFWFVRGYRRRSPARRISLGAMAGLAVLLVSTARGSVVRLRDRTRLYRVIDVIGRWSMIDVFMLAILVALVQNGQIGTVIPDYGAVCFGAVVVLTMLASESFDPRLMWDAAQRTERARARAGRGAPAAPAAPAAWNPAT